ncbi:MAG: transketolase [Spirochaetaceae bacterium]|jgi:transketolase|nr:transketolase [Spirochaetaceae bacterium]
MEIVQRPYQNAFLDWSRDKHKVLVLTADLTNSCEVGVWAKEYPDRYFSMGLTEQNMIGVAAGLARKGFYPYIHTFAVFIYRRPFDQLAMSVAYPNLPVRFMGFLPGVTTPGGVTHQAIDDIAIMRAVPNMTIISIGDATEAETCLDAVQAVQGPVYVRMLRGEVPRIFSKDDPFVFNKARVLSRGNDIAIISEGICTEEAIKASVALKNQGLGITHVHVSTLKPFSDSRIPRIIDGVKYGVITLENHLASGGLGSAVSELISDRGIGKRLIRLGLQDTYAHGASKPYLMKKYGLDAIALVGAAEKLTGQKFCVNEDTFASIRLETANPEAKAEAL